MTPPQPKEAAPLTPEKVAELRALLEAATPGPWGWARADLNSGNRPWITQLDEGAASGAVICLMQPPAGVSDLPFQPWPPDHQIYKNARFLCAAINALPSLLAEREDLLAKVERLTEAAHEVIAQDLNVETTSVSIAAFDALDATLKEDTDE